MYVNDSSTPFIETPQEYSKVNLGHDQNTFSFDFSIIGFQHAEESVYEYKLDGYDENWIRSGKTHFARYSKIAPANYLFPDPHPGRQWQDQSLCENPGHRNP